MSLSIEMRFPFGFFLHFLLLFLSYRSPTPILSSLTVTNRANLKKVQRNHQRLVNEYNVHHFGKCWINSSALVVMVMLVMHFLFTNWILLFHSIHSIMSAIFFVSIHSWTILNLCWTILTAFIKYRDCYGYTIMFQWGREGRSKWIASSWNCLAVLIKIRVYSTWNIHELTSFCLYMFSS